MRQSCSFYQLKDGSKSLLRKSGKFQRVGAHLGMQRMLVEKLVFNMIIASENHLKLELRQSQVKK